MLFTPISSSSYALAEQRLHLEKQRLLVLGSTGAVGRALATVWKSAMSGSGMLDPVWQHRAGREPPALPNLIWDMLVEPPPILPKHIGGIIALAGVMSGESDNLAANTTLARAALELAKVGIGTSAVRVLIASSQAVYGHGLEFLHEDALCMPTNAYGAAKLDMERSLADEPNTTFLRIGNVAGCDSLFRQAAIGSVKLDHFQDGSTPERSYIGPITLARVLSALMAHPEPLPPVLNIAQPGTLSMSELLLASKVSYEPKPAPVGVARRVALDVSALAKIVPLTPINAQELAAEVYASGWRPYNLSTVA